MQKERELERERKREADVEERDIPTSGTSRRTARSQNQQFPRTEPDGRCSDMVDADVRGS